MYAEQRPCTVCLQSLVLIAPASFPLMCRHKDKTHKSQVGLVGWGLTALLNQFRSHRAFKVKTILYILKV